MPPEPLPWDRKDLFRERKHSNHESSPSDSLGSVARWRDFSSSSHGSRNEFGRWGFFPEFRRPPGQGKQGGWDLCHEAAVHCYPTPQSGDRLMEEDGFRPFGPRADGRYARNYRENRASLNQKDWKGRVWENNHHHNMPSNAAVRKHELNDQRSADDMLMHASCPDSDTLNASDLHHDKDQANKSSDVNGLGMSQRIDKEISFGLDWKPLKWSRSGSLASRGSGFSHSSSSRSVGGESSDTRSELLAQNATAVESPPGDPFACATSAAPLEETVSRKKPRLGWGEGLAKFEKRKVEFPDENANNNGYTVCNNNVERTHSVASNLADRSPRIAGFSDCVSPATPSSVGCSSSPGMEDKSFGKLMDIDLDSSNDISVSPSLVSQIQVEGSSFSLEDLECSLIANLSALLSELLQSEDQNMVDSGFVKSSALNKLLLWKKDITKALELTESEVDSLENKLRSLRSDAFRGSPHPESSSSVPVDCKEQPQKELNMIPRPPPLDVLSSGDIVSDRMDPCCNIVAEAHGEAREKEIDSPGTATSKYVLALSLEKPISPNSQKSACPEGMVNVRSVKPEANLLVTSAADVNRIVGSSGDSIQESDTFGNADRFQLTNSENCAYDKILASNQDAAGKASEVFIKLLPNCDYHINIADAIRAASSENELLVRKKFLLRKRYLRFKERVISLKYRAFQHLWKEDLRLLSVRKHRAKSQKKLELSSRVMQSGCQKNRSSIRYRFASPAGRLSLVPSSEILTHTSKLLSDSQVKLYRNILKMPALILDEKERVLSRFISSNGLVEDPCAVEKERSFLNLWTAEEKMIFMDKLAAFGKDFRKISSFLDHKTTADCIEFYYKNHKSEWFEERKKKPELKKQEKSLPAKTYLVTSSKKCREMNSISLDLLGAASAIVAYVDEGMDSTKLFPGRFSDMKSKAIDGILERSGSYNVEAERETTAADVLAGICRSVSSEAMSSCITSSVDPGEGSQEWKCQKGGLSIRRPLTPEVTQKVDDDSCSDESCGEMDPVDDWTDEEKSAFVQAFSSYGKDFVMISQCVQTKSRDQCKVFFSKAWKCLGLEIVCPVTGHEGTPATSDRNGSGSDGEYACVLKAGSAVSSDKSGSRMFEDLRMPISDKDHSDNKCVAMNSNDDEIMGEDCHPEVKSENMPSYRHQADDASEMTLDGVVANDEGEKSVRVQDQEIKLVSDALGGKEVQTTGQVNVACVSPSTYAVVVDPNVLDEVVSEKPESDLETRDVSTPDVPSSAENLEGTTENLEGTEKECRKPHASKNIHQPVSGQTLIDHGESSTILKRNPFVSVHTHVKENVGLKQLSAVEGVLKTQTKFQSLEECHLKKCSRVASQDLVTELNFLPESQVQAKDIGSYLPSPSDNEKPCGNGDVKLFGQILTKPSTVEKPLPSVKENEDKGANHYSSAGVLDVKPSVNDNMNDNLISPNYDHANYLGLENFPIRSYGFWDGTRIRTGYTSLPHNATLLAKCPAAFSNCSPPSSKTDQQILNTSECHLNGASVFPTRESCSSNGGLADHQVCRSQDAMQPFRLEMKQRQDMLSEVQRNGLEGVSSLQRQQVRGNGFVKLNVVQGISDPVAALKLHYAKAQAVAAGNGNGKGIVVREEESWSGQ